MMSKKSKFILIILIICVFLVLFFMNRTDETHMYKNVQLLLVNEKSEIVREEITAENGMNNDLQNHSVLLSIDTNMDSYYDLILMNNLEQVEFSINDLEYNTIHHVQLPKTEGLTKRKFKLNLKNLNNGLNDCCLIFLESDSEYKNMVHTLRFSIRYDEALSYNNEREYNYTATVDKSLYEDKLIDINFADSITILDKMFNPIEGTINMKEEIYLLLDFDTTIKESNFRDEYLTDKQSKIIMPISIFALDGSKQIYISSNIEVININSYLSDSVVVKIMPNALKSSMQNLRFFAVAYPYDSPNNKLKSYKLINWNNILYTSEFSVK